MIFENQTFDQERALYGLQGAIIKNCRFDGKADGESALKEAGKLKVSGCFMNLRYPFWHVTDAKISGTEFTENCRAALWYDTGVTLEMEGFVFAMLSHRRGRAFRTSAVRFILPFALLTTERLRRCYNP